MHPFISSISTKMMNLLDKLEVRLHFCYGLKYTDSFCMWMFVKRIYFTVHNTPWDVVCHPLNIIITIKERTVWGKDNSLKNTLGYWYRNTMKNYSLAHDLVLASLKIFFYYHAWQSILVYVYTHVTNIMYGKKENYSESLFLVISNNMATTKNVQLKILSVKQH